MTTHHSVKAEVSVYYDGRVYIGVKAREKLELGYNDKVTVTIPRQMKDDIEVTGYLNAANSFGCGVDLFRELRGRENSSGPQKVEAIVEKRARTWEDNNGMTKHRYDGYQTLDCK